MWKCSVDPEFTSNEVSIPQVVQVQRKFQNKFYFHNQTLRNPKPTETNH